MRYDVEGDSGRIEIRTWINGWPKVAWKYDRFPETTLKGWTDKSMIGYQYPMTIGDLKACWRSLTIQEDDQLLDELESFIRISELVPVLAKEMDL